MLPEQAISNVSKVSLTIHDYEHLVRLYPVQVIITNKNNYTAKIIKHLSQEYINYALT